MDDNTVIQYLEERILKNPKSLLFARLADNYISRGRMDEAIQLCKAGIKYHPEYTTGYLILSKAFLIKEDFENAETELKRVLSRDRHYIAAHKLLADLMVKMGWENTAAMHYKDILKIDPLNEEATQSLSKLDIPNITSPIEELHIEPDFLEEEPPEGTIQSPHQQEDVLLDELEEVFSSSEAEIIEEKTQDIDSPSFWPEDNIKEEDEQAIEISQKIEDKISNLDEQIQEEISEEIAIDSIEPVAATPTLPDVSDDDTTDIELDISDDELIAPELEKELSSEKSSLDVLDELEDLSLDIEAPENENIEDIQNIDLEMPNEAESGSDETISSAIESVFKNVTPITEISADSEKKQKEPENIHSDKDAENQLDEISNMPEFMSSEDMLPSEISSQPLPPVVNGLPKEDNENEIFDIDIDNTLKKNSTGDEISSEETYAEPTKPIDIITEDKESQKPTPDTDLEIPDISEDIPTSDIVFSEETEIQSESTEIQLEALESDETLPTQSEDLSEEAIESNTEASEKTEKSDELQIPETNEPSIASELAEDFESDPVAEEDIFEPELLDNASIGESVEKSDSLKEESKFLNKENFEIDEFSDVLIKEADESEKTKENKEAAEFMIDDDFDFSLEILEEIDRHIEEASQAAKNSILDVPEETPKSSKIQESQQINQPLNPAQATETASPETIDEPQPFAKESKIVSPTLGEIYIAQGEYTKAIRVYEMLLEKNPAEIRYQQKIEELQQKLDSSEENS